MDAIRNVPDNDLLAAWESLTTLCDNHLRKRWDELLAVEDELARRGLFDEGA